MMCLYYLKEMLLFEQHLQVHNINRYYILCLDDLKIESVGGTCKISNSKGIYITGKHGVQRFLQIFFNPSHSMALKHEGGTMCRQHKSKNIEFQLFPQTCFNPNIQSFNSMQK